MPPLPEITSDVLLCDGHGRLNRASVGWARHPHHTANLTGRARNKRWEYWAVQSPAHVLAVTVSDLDYAALCAVYFLAPDGSETVVSKLAPLTRVHLPDRSGAGPVSVRLRGLSIDLQPTDAGVQLVVDTPALSADIVIERPVGHESLSVVVPWSDARFQYTVKENTLPATGTIRVGNDTYECGPDSWATLDHGRGRWPYRVTWNWGSGSGSVGDSVIGIQVGGKWTDGTGSTENALTVDGRIHYIGEELAWEYDPSDWLAPWRVCSPTSDRVDLTFTPRHVRTDRVNLGILANDTHQAFGAWAGTMTDDQGRVIRVDGLRGWAEEVRNRW